MKVGRNDPCPCGSGLKYKKCCINKPIPTLSKLNKSYKTGDSKYLDYLNKHESSHVLNLITGLQLIPKNHGKNIRIEILAKEAVRTLKTGNDGEPNLLIEIMKEEYPSHHLEDPPVELFTEDVIFHGGNYTTFPGIASNGPEIFKHLSSSIFVYPNNLPKPFKDLLYKGITFILELGQILITKAGLSRNLFESDIEDALIFPEIVDYSFSPVELNELCNSKGFDSQIIQEFIANPEDGDFADSDSESNPLIYKPIVMFGGRYYFVLPSSELTTINEFILSEAKKFNQEKEILKLYHESIWKDINYACERMNWILTDIKLSIKNPELPIHETIFQFDINHLAYVCYISESAETTLKSVLTGPRKPSAQSELVSKHITNNLTELKNRADFRHFKFLKVVLLGGTGKFSTISIDKSDGSYEVLWFDALEFLPIAFNRTWKHLDLYKFAKSFRLNSENTKFQFFSMIDLYSLYKAKGESFYLSDDTKYNMVSIPPGDGGELIRTAKVERDYHGALAIINGDEAYIPVERAYEYAPVYQPIHSFYPFHMYIKAFQFPLWIVCENKKLRNSSFLRHFSNAVAFWINKLSPQIAAQLQNVITSPFSLFFDFEQEFISDLAATEVETWEDKVKIDYKLINNGIAFFIPKELRKILKSNSNKGERILMFEIIKAFNHIPGIAFNDVNIQTIIDTLIPLGPAKMLLLLDTQKDMQIDPRWLVSDLYLSDAEVNILLDQLPQIIGPEIAIPANISDDAKNEFCHQVVNVLITALTEKVSKFENEKLLNTLMRVYETLIQRREFNKIIIPAQIHCFGDLPKRINKLLNKESKLVITSLTLRCLIEYVASQPTSGTEIPSYDAIDELLAHMNLILDYGTRSDAINFKFDNPTIGLLKSGRIGISDSPFHTKLKQFEVDSTHANVDIYLDEFTEIFESTGIEVSKDKIITLQAEVDKAFLDDWGVSLTHLHTLCHCAMIIAVENKLSVCKMTQVELISNINRLAIIPHEEIIIGLERLTLVQRTEYLKAPDGFKNHDVYPWKYNKEFSYIRRPFIKIGTENSQYIWGMRNALDATNKLHSLLNQGRLKNGGPALKAVQGTITRIMGSRFRNNVLAWLKTNSHFIFWEHEVTMSPAGHIKTEKNYGDIDILAYDKDSKTLFILECKRTTQAKNIHQMKQELDNYFGRNGNNGMIQKHVERETALKDNLEKIKSFTGDIEINEIKSIIITSEVIPVYYLKSGELPLPLIAFPQLKRNGVSILLK